MSNRATNDILTKIVEELHAPLLLFARQWLSDDAEDIVQEAFLRLLRELHQSTEKIENNSAWLFRVVRNESISRLRRRQLIRCYAENIQAEKKPWFESQHESTLDAIAIADHISSLPMELREVLIPRLWGDLSFQEIGELTETSQSTAHRRYNEALALIKDKLKDQ